MYRENPPEVKLGGQGSVIQDNKYLQIALAANNGYYLFSEVGAGVKPLILLGTPSEISTFFKDTKTLGIENRIKELPNIYVGMVPYVPGERFTGLIPLHAVVKQLTKNVNDMGIAITASSGLAQNIVGVIRDAGVYLLERFGKETNKNSQNKLNKHNGVLYMKFSYIQEPGMTKIGTHRVDFKNLVEIFLESEAPIN